MRAQLWGGLPSQLPAAAGAIYYDTETSGLHPDDGARVSVVSAAWIEGDCVYYDAWPFAQGTEGKPQDEDGGLMTKSQASGEQGLNLDREQWYALLAWLQHEGCGLIGHNVKFDVAMMRAGVDGLRAGTEGWIGGELGHRVIWDTQVAAKELEPTERSALKGPGSVSERGWGQTDDEKQALKPYLGPQKNPRYDLVPWAVMRPYAANDALMTAKAHLLQDRRVGRGEVAAGGASGRHWVNRETRVLQVLASMERRGVPYDAAGSLVAAAQVAMRQEAIEKLLPFDPRTEKDTKGYFFGKDKGQLGLVPYSVTEKKREPQLTAEVLDAMIKDRVPNADKLRAWNKLDTAGSMWYRPYAAGVGQDGRLRTVFRQVASGFEGEGGTRSGRFSVERVNLQAIPHDYRLSDFDVLEGIPTPRQLIGQGAKAIEGWKLWELDLAQAELRVAAMWAGCTRMLDAIRAGDDLHGLTATALFGVRKGEQAWGAMRQVAKRGNFSLIFGSGWLTFKRMVRKETGIELPDHEAQRIVSEWNQLYPEFRRAIDAHSRRVENRVGGIRGVPLVNGRVRWFTPWEDTHKAFNQRVQASLAEFGKDWMLATERQLATLDREQVDGGLVLVIHDSQVLLLPEHGGQAMAQAVATQGEQLWAVMFPDVPGGVDVKEW